MPPSLSNVKEAREAGSTKHHYNNVLKVAQSVFFLFIAAVLESHSVAASSGSS